MCTVLLPPGDNPIALNKYIISYLYCEEYVCIYTHIGVRTDSICVTVATK